MNHLDPLLFFVLPTRCDPAVPFPPLFLFYQFLSFFGIPRSTQVPGPYGICPIFFFFFPPQLGALPTSNFFSLTTFLGGVFFHIFSRLFHPPHLGSSFKICPPILIDFFLFFFVFPLFLTKHLYPPFLSFFLLLSFPRFKGAPLVMAPLAFLDFCSFFASPPPKPHPLAPPVTLSIFPSRH